MSRQPSVQDHLHAFGETPDWVLSLGQAIYDSTRCSAAIAASRARDLSRRPEVGRGLEALLRGWQALDGAELSDLSPMQLETVQLVVHKMLETLNGQVRDAAATDPDREEVSA